VLRHSHAVLVETCSSYIGLSVATQMEVNFVIGSLKAVNLIHCLTYKGEIEIKT
jgi:hypothetical protein